MKKAQSKIGKYIQDERQFTLIKCRRCREFYKKGRPHICHEENSMKLSSSLIGEDTGNDV